MLVVTPVSYPHLYVVHEYIPRVIAVEGWFQNVASIEIADIEEVEMFEDSIPRGLRLGSFLADKAGTNPNIPIKNVLLSQTAERIGEPAIVRGAAFVDTVVERFRA